MQEPDGFVKIVADKNSKKIIGATVIGVYATELLSLVTNFVALNMKIEDAKRLYMLIRQYLRLFQKQSWGLGARPSISGSESNKVYK